MDEIWLTMAFVLGCGGYGAALGAAFGAVAGAVYWGSGRAAGTGLGQRVVSAFENAGGRSLPRLTRGVLVGATDGFLFLGVVGTALGLTFAYTGDPDAAVLVPLAVGGVLVAVAAVVFGVLAYAVVRNGDWAVIGLFLGGVAGAFTAALLLGAERLLWGVVPGLIAGTWASFLLRKYEPRFRAPRAAKATHERWRTGGEDVTAEPPPDGPDSIQKAQPSEE
jgi:hypothetical protein